MDADSDFGECLVTMVVGWLVLFKVDHVFDWGVVVAEVMRGVGLIVGVLLLLVDETCSVVYFDVVLGVDC